MTIIRTVISRQRVAHAVELDVAVGLAEVGLLGAAVIVSGRMASLRQAQHRHGFDPTVAWGGTLAWGGFST